MVPPPGPNGPDNAAAAEPWRTPGPTYLVFRKWQRELFKTILEEGGPRCDREGPPSDGPQPAPHLHLPAPDGRPPTSIKSPKIVAPVWR